MPDYLPPPDYSGTPHRHVLPTGTRLWRVHSQKRDATEFTTPHSDLRGAGERFDGTFGDPYEVYYAGLDAAAAVVPVVLRGVPFSSKGSRFARRATVAGLRASVVATSADLSLVDLRTATDLAAVAQDTWLTTADPRDFPMTRRWASWLRTKATWAHGFLWATRGNPAHQSIVLFGDRCASSILDPQPRFEVDLDDEYGAVLLNSLLVPYDAQIMPPRKNRSHG